MKNKTIKRIIISLTAGFLVIILLVSALLIGIVINMNKGLKDSKAFQSKHIEELETLYASTLFQPVNEQDFCDFDLNYELNNNLKYNDIQYIATHNSYKLELTKFSKAVFDIFGGIFGAKKGEYEYSMPTISEQLNNGIRFMELDVNYVRTKGEWEMLCSHHPILDNTSNAINFSKGLKEISLWSENNPNHLPITVFIEPKSDFLYMNRLKEFGMDGVIELEQMLIDTFGDSLFTPAHMIGEYTNFKEMTIDNAWPELKDMLGKVLFVLFPDHNQEYNALDTTMQTQKMFMSVWYHKYKQNLDSFSLNTPFIMTNYPDTEMNDNTNAIKYFLQRNYFVRTRLDFYPEVNFHTVNAGKNSGAQLLTTDYPKGSRNKNNYYTSFENDFTIRLRPDIS